MLERCRGPDRGSYRADPGRTPVIGRFAGLIRGHGPAGVPGGAVGCAARGVGLDDELRHAPYRRPARATANQGKLPTLTGSGWPTKVLSQRNWETSGIAGLLSEAGMSTMEFVLRCTLSHPGPSTTIAGTSNPVHLASNIAVAERRPLPAGLYEQAKNRLPLPDARLPETGGVSST
jgi:hypothetical protein